MANKDMMISEQDYLSGEKLADCRHEFVLPYFEMTLTLAAVSSGI